MVDLLTRPDQRGVHVYSAGDSRLGGRDRTRATEAAAEFLAALGVPLDGEHTERTAERMTDAYLEMLTPRDTELTTFPNSGGNRELVIERQIRFTSLCAHHMLPFIGVAHVGYIPGERLLGLSKIARLVELFSRRPQVQEDLVAGIAGWLDDNLATPGVGVVASAVHLCMTERGARAHGTTTVTSAYRGTLLEDRTVRGEFLALAGTISAEWSL
ncbi:GTP cyclohydrolase 1 [Longispora fulva]|uniref:GTP cyclohydrolase 1 n=1 Tax=Longispora fulva TaxID=619741 RepID=A0A8J7GMF1_9ACTN|nr:GTP cyclohydrolase I [Longispora fulva]MBG6140455.1 GTP cyclohydrolase I [Longispora fulva]GIG57163.1 GTP cyclohydrolase 1 [Longispora fulva]